MKKLTAVFLCLVVILAFCSCAKGEAPVAPNGGAEEKTPVITKSEKAPDDEASPVEELETKYGASEADLLTWEYVSSSKTLVISGEGAMRDYLSQEPDWYGYSGEAERIVIGEKVTSVGSGAFMYFTAVTEVELGEAVEYVGTLAFSNCVCLRTVNFPAGLKYVGCAAFNNDLLHSDSGFILPEGLLYVGEDAFRSAFKESYVSIPASLTEIGTGAFCNCFVEEFRVDPANAAYVSADGVLYSKDMTVLINYPADSRSSVYEIPGTVTTVMEEAIAVTNSLEKLVIPASVTEIAEGAVMWNYGLAAIEVDVGSSAYKSVDGVLFTGDGKKLICYPAAHTGTEYTVPQGCERICNFAVSQAANLIEIHTNEGLSEIGEFGLFGCCNLTELGLPESLRCIEYCGLDGCYILSKVSFAGNSEEWSALELGENNDAVLANAKIVFAK